MTIPYTITETRISVLLDGRYRSLLSKSDQGMKLEGALKEAPQDLDKIRMLVDVPAYIAVHTFGRVIIDDHENVRLDGVKVDYGMIATLKRVVADGFDPTPMVKFIENVALNPDLTIAADLYPFLEKGNHPLTEDGCFLAFKRVDEEWRSFSSGWGEVYYPDSGEWVQETGCIRYPLLGQTRMKREDCDPSQGTACSKGLHVCSFEYLKGFHGGRGKIIIVKINPRDVTAFPSHYEAKLRCCLVEIVGEIPEADAQEHFQRAVDLRYPELLPPVDFFAIGREEGLTDGAKDRELEYDFAPTFEKCASTKAGEKLAYMRGYLEGYVEGFGAEEPEGEMVEVDGDEEIGPFPAAPDVDE